MTARLASGVAGVPPPDTASGVAGVPPPDAAAIVNALPDAVFLADGGDVVRFVNPAAEQFFGAGAGALQGQALAGLVQFDSPLLALTATARENLATLAGHDVDMLSARRPTRTVDIQVAAMAEAEGWVLVTLRERSIAEKLDRQLTHRGAGRSVAGLAATLAHEIKNPLSGIRGAAQLLAREASPGDRELTGLITDETDRICRLVDRMEMFSDDRSTPRTPLNIHEILEHVRLIARNGFARHLRLVERYDPSLPEVLGDRDQLVQVFLNLVKNAAEAAPGTGGEIVIGTAFEPGVRLSVAGGDERIRLPLAVTIQDNGDGIPDDLRDCLFDPFVTGKAGGTGLGLSLVAKIIGDHGGMIEFTREPRRTVFRVLLPVIGPVTSPGGAPE
jgi:two-component system nitrogen regulation sensor histidine kinase GlnL